MEIFPSVCVFFVSNLRGPTSMKPNEKKQLAQPTKISCDMLQDFASQVDPYMSNRMTFAAPTSNSDDAKPILNCSPSRFFFDASFADSN